MRLYVGAALQCGSTSLTQLLICFKLHVAVHVHARSIRYTSEQGYQGREADAFGGQRDALEYDRREVQALKRAAKAVPLYFVVMFWCAPYGAFLLVCPIPAQ